MPVVYEKQHANIFICFEDGILLILITYSRGQLTEFCLFCVTDGQGDLSERDLRVHQQVGVLYSQSYYIKWHGDFGPGSLFENILGHFKCKHKMCLLIHIILAYRQ